METIRSRSKVSPQKKGVSKEKTEQYCGFKIEEDIMAVSVLDVQEIIKPQKVTTVPIATPHIRGLINLRGQIVTIISLRKLFGLDDDFGRDYMNVIVRSGDSLSALMVDDICDVMEVESTTFEDAPDTLGKNLRPYVKGVHKLPENLLVVLNLNKILSE